MTSESMSVSEQIEVAAENAFGFLTMDRDGKVLRRRNESRSLLPYLGPGVFLEVELDWRERAVFVLVGQLIDGRRPDGYYVSTQGRKVRWQLAAVLAESSDPEILASANEIRQVTRESGPEAMLKQIDRLAEAARRSLSELPALLANL